MFDLTEWLFNCEIDTTDINHLLAADDHGLI